MKPLLIIPPAPQRWHAMERLLLDEAGPWLADLEKRFRGDVAGSNDVFAVLCNGGQFVAGACVVKRGECGLLAQVLTRADHRQRGFARRLIDTVVSWFDMVGGKWLYAAAPAELGEKLFAPAGFTTIRRCSSEPNAAAMMLRTAKGAAADPLHDAVGDVTIRDATRAELPLIVALLQHRLGPDPRVDIDESALAAAATALELIDQQERGTCGLKAAFCGERLVGLASVAIDAQGERTYAMQIPYGEALPTLRDAVIEFAKSKGYPGVAFPMEALAAHEDETPASGTVPRCGAEGKTE